MASLLRDRKISVESLDMILMFILRIIEKLEDKDETLKTFDDHGLFEYLVDTYIYQQNNEAIALKIIQFFIFCLESGLKLVQEIFLRLLRHNISNSFINAVKKNLSDSFTKFD